MKIVKNLILRIIAGEAVLVPVGETASEYNGLISMTETAQTIWENLEKVESEDELVQIMLDEYEVDVETARADVRGFADALVEYGIAEYTDSQKKW